jgi:hypothetical protein
MNLHVQGQKKRKKTNGFVDNTRKLIRSADESTLHLGSLLAANSARPSAQTCAAKWPLLYRQQAADVYYLV